jgi:hypothetical protein
MTLTLTLSGSKAPALLLRRLPRSGSTHVACSAPIAIAYPTPLGAAAAGFIGARRSLGARTRVRRFAAPSEAA